MHWLFLLILCVVGWPTILAADTGSDLTYLTNNQRGEKRGRTDDPWFPPEETLAEDFTGYKNRYAFIVGITRYKNFSPLKGPGYDAVAVANILAERYGFTVRLLVDNNQLHVKETVQKSYYDRISKDIFTEELGKFQTKVENPSESQFVFYYSGHGLRTVTGDTRLGFLVPADGDENKPETVLAFAELAEKIADYQPHHTLLVLDACYSGTIFDPASQVLGIFQNQLLSQQAKLTSGNSALERALVRPVVQAITAGGGFELVADQAKMSAEYMKIRSEEAKSLSQHSPFTALLIQLLSGRIGIGNKQGDHIPMGTISGSMLGYEIPQALMDNSPLRNINQTPRYNTLAGEGDVLLMPSRKVLNPRLVGALYLQGERYQSLRASGIGALLTEAELKTSKGAEPTKPDLVLEALPHFSYALSDSSTQVKEAALDALIKLLNNYKEQPVEDFRKIISSLVKILNYTSGTDVPLRHKAALLLGKLPDLADKAAVDAMKQYIAQQLRQWEQRLERYGLTENKHHPVEVRNTEKRARLESETEYPTQTMAQLEERRQAAQWLLVYGLKVIQADITQRSFKNVKELDKAILDEQKNVTRLKEHLGDTSSELEGTQAKFKKWLDKSVEILQELSDTRYEYQLQQAEHQVFKRRYRQLNVNLNMLIARLPKYDSRLNSFKKEVRKIEDDLNRYIERKIAKELALENQSSNWKKIDTVLNKVIQFAEQQTQQVCPMLDKANSELLLSDYLLSQLPKALSELLSDWFQFEFELEQDTWYYQSVRQILKDELKEGTKLRVQLEQQCDKWTAQGPPQINWQKLYQNVLKWRELVAEIKGVQTTQEALSPTVDGLKKEVVDLKQDIKAKENAKRQAEEDLKNSQAEKTHLQQKLKDTDNDLQTVNENIRIARSDLDELKTQKKQGQTLLDTIKKGLKRLKDFRQYFCREKEEHCPQSPYQQAQ